MRTRNLVQPGAEISVATFKTILTITRTGWVSNSTLSKAGGTAIYMRHVLPLTQAIVWVMEGLSTNGIDDHDIKGLNLFLGDNAFRIA